MTNAEREDYRQRLVQLGQRLRGDVATVADQAFRRSGGEASGSLSNAPLHMADLGTDNWEQETAVGLLENEQMLLEQTAAALQRIEDGTYGGCLECGQEIPAERLKALPYTPHCVTCALKLQGSGGASATPTNL